MRLKTLLVLILTTSPLFGQTEPFPTGSIGYNFERGLEATIGIASQLGDKLPNYPFNPFFGTLDLGVNTTFTELDFFLNAGIWGTIGFGGGGIDFSFVFSDVQSNPKWIFRPSISVHLLVLQAKMYFDIDPTSSDEIEPYLGILIGVL